MDIRDDGRPVRPGGRDVKVYCATTCPLNRDGLCATSAVSIVNGKCMTTRKQQVRGAARKVIDQYGEALKRLGE